MSIEDVLIQIYKDYNSNPEFTNFRTNSYTHRKSQIVQGEGSLSGTDGDRWMFIGERPGAFEDRTGRPFSGPAGNIYEELLASIGVTRETVFTTNLIKYKIEGRRPLPTEIAESIPYLMREIDLVNPRIIVPMGALVTSIFLKEIEFKFSRGRAHERDGRFIIPMHQPTWASRRYHDSETAFQRLLSDYQVIRTTYDKWRESTPDNTIRGA